MADVPRSPLRLLARGPWRYKVRVVGSWLLLACWQMCEALVPVFIGLTVDRAVETGDLSAMLLWAALTCVLFAVLSTAYRLGARLGFGVVQRVTHELRVAIAAHVLAPAGARTSLLPGETLTLATSDAERVGAVVRQAGFTFAALSSVAVSAWVLLDRAPVIGVVVLTGVPLVLVVIQLLTPLIARRSTAQQASIARATGTATDLVRGLRPLKGVGAEAEMSRRFKVVSQEACGASIRSARSYGYLDALTKVLSGLLLALVTLLAGRMALDGELTIGTLIAIVGLTQFLAEPIELLGYVTAQTASSYASARRILDFLGTAPLAASGDGELDAEQPDLELRGVTTGPLRGLSLRAEPGELLGVAVDDPAVADALVRLLRCELPGNEWQGELLLGGRAYDGLSLDARRSRVVVDQHAVDLFDGTLATNVDLEQRLTRDELGRVLEASAAEDVVALHQDGLDQPVRSGGSTFSGGQRQRIALARALGSGSPLLVLNEPTTAIDAVTEHRIAQGIRSLRHAPGSLLTTVVITSSPTLLSHADRVLLVRDGVVASTGTHEALLADESYRAMVLR